MSDPFTDKVPENISKLAERMKMFTQKICTEHKGEEIICVSHDFPIVSLKLTLENKPLGLMKNYQVATASISTFELDENCNLVESHYTEFAQGPQEPYSKTVDPQPQKSLR
jgi:broad specificity phosphatase PhoE